MAKISESISESLREYLILTGWIRAKPENVSLETKLGDSISLQYPYMTARMQCIVGPDMAVSAGRNGILTCIPRSLRDEDKQKIIDANNKARLKRGDIEFIDDPEFTNPDEKLEDVIKLVNKTGYSVIPVFDRFSRIYGFYNHDPDHPPSVPPYTKIKEVMIPLKSNGAKEGISISYNDDKKEIHHIINKEDIGFVPIVDKEQSTKEDFGLATTWRGSFTIKHTEK